MRNMMPALTHLFNLSLAMTKQGIKDRTKSAKMLKPKFRVSRGCCTKADFPDIITSLHVARTFFPPTTQTSPRKLSVPEFADGVTSEQDETGDEKSAKELGNNDKVQQPLPPAVSAHQNEQGDGEGDAAKHDS
jgi:hypothetical protein